MSKQCSPALSLAECVSIFHLKTRQILTCGTHLGDTKLVASMTGSPDSDNKLIKLIFASVGTTL